jgi:hypothetical protein
VGEDRTRDNYGDGLENDLRGKKGGGGARAGGGSRDRDGGRTRMNGLGDTRVWWRGGGGGGGEGEQAEETF